MGSLIHLWHSCHNCGQKPIVGQRFECEFCPSGPDRDLCRDCYQLLELGKLEHPDRTKYHDFTTRGPHPFRAVDGRESESYLPWLTVAESDVPPPPVPRRFVVRPEFRCGRESFFGSYAFIIAPEAPHSMLLLTALHVMDELIKSKNLDCSGNNARYTGEELPKIVTGVNLYDVFADNWMLALLGSAGSMLSLCNARVGDEEPYSQRDIAAFRISNAASVCPVKLAETSPPTGEPVWLVANSGRTTNVTMMKATVVECSDETLIFRFAGEENAPRFTSGAPLLNCKSEVVGINIGAGSFQGRRFGHANHARSIRQHLATAAG